MNFSRLAEELGELAETIRILPTDHAYLLNEAADMFAWLMGMANQLEHRDGYARELGVQLEESLWNEYPGRCRHCGSERCKCPPILSSTLGRLSREMPTSVFPLIAELFDFEQSIEFFRIGDEAIFVEGEKVRITAELLQEVTYTSRLLLDHMQELVPLQQGLDAKFRDAFSQLENLASRQELTQESVDQVLAVLREMPSESRNVVVGFLSNLAAGIWLEVLLEFLT